jgi:hypothetical protein
MYTSDSIPCDLVGFAYRSTFRSTAIASKWAEISL